MEYDNLDEIWFKKQDNLRQDKKNRIRSVKIKTGE